MTSSSFYNDIRNMENEITIIKKRTLQAEQNTIEANERVDKAEKYIEQIKELCEITKINETVAIIRAEIAEKNLIKAEKQAQIRIEKAEEHAEIANMRGEKSELCLEIAIKYIKENINKDDSDKIIEQITKKRKYNNSNDYKMPLFCNHPQCWCKGESKSVCQVKNKTRCKEFNDWCKSEY